MRHSLLYTTVRPDQVVQVIYRWSKRCDNPANVQWCITTDLPLAAEIREEISMAARMFDVRDVRFGTVDAPPYCANRAWNLGAKLSDGDYLYMVPDDIYPPEHWDTEVERAFAARDGVLHTVEGRPGDPLTHPIVSRAWYEKFGYFLYPNYMSMYDDTELAERARELGAIIDARPLTFLHRHWVLGTRTKDSVDELHAGRIDRSRELFEWRKAHGWPAPSMAAPRVHSDYAAYLQVNRDDFCLMETCQALLRNGVRQFFFHFQMRGWDGSFTPANQLADVERVVDRLRRDADVVLEQHWATIRKDEPRIILETRVRSAALASMRARGWRFVLLVDGDEVYREGALAKIHAIARHGWHAIEVNTIPVVGLPGYPVRSEHNRFTAYIGPDADLLWCRKTTIAPAVIDDELFFHFTAVRGSMTEIVRKHRGSGHGDDAEYAMEKWIADTLPKLRPGMRNAHMWKDGSIWNEVREFTLAEWAEIPARLKKFLGKPKK